MSNAYTTRFIPELNKITVFNKGIAHGFNVSNPSGGQTPPNIKLGFILESKNAQKNAKRTWI